MKRILTVAFSLLFSFIMCGTVFFAAGCSPAESEKIPPAAVPDKDGAVEENKRAITFIDEFDGDRVSDARWEFQTGTGDLYGLDRWGNGEAQYYRRENAAVSEGMLKIELKRQTYGGMDYTSARLRTKGKFSQAYGRFEARIRIDGGMGIWPAFWLMPEDDAYGGWPFSGEIDIMEIKGRKETMSSSAVHYAAANGDHQYKTKEDFLPFGTITDFHIYALEWQKEKMTFYVDDSVLLEVTNWRSGTNGFPAPYDQKFHIILNLACGGHFDGFILPSDEELPASMYVDYVKVYAPSEM